MSELRIDLSTTSDEQLVVLATIYPAEVAEERAKRLAYASYPDLFTALAQLEVDMLKVIESMRQTPAIKAVRGTGVVETLQRCVATAKSLKVPYDRPRLPGATVAEEV
jgi:hypothetical protein